MDTDERPVDPAAFSWSARTEEPRRRRLGVRGLIIGAAVVAGLAAVTVALILTVHRDPYDDAGMRALLPPTPVGAQACPGGDQSVGALGVSGTVEEKYGVTGAVTRCWWLDNPGAMTRVALVKFRHGGDATAMMTSLTSVMPSAVGTVPSVPGSLVITRAGADTAVGVRGRFMFTVETATAPDDTTVRDVALRLYQRLPD